MPFGGDAIRLDLSESRDHHTSYNGEKKKHHGNADRELKDQALDAPPRTVDRAIGGVSRGESGAACLNEYQDNEKNRDQDLGNTQVWKENLHLLLPGRLD